VHHASRKEDVIFNELFITWEEPIVLVEGIFDCLSVNRNAIPLLGSSLSDKSMLFKKIMHYKPDVILMLDNDNPGKFGTTKAGELLVNYGIKTFITEYDKKDPGELTKKEVFQTLKNKKLFTRAEGMRRILEE
jgi:DNA primase